MSSVLVAVRVPASPERAFRLFTEELGLWWRPNPLFAFTRRSPGVLSLEPRAGGRFVETLADGRVFEIGRVLLWDPPARLRLSWRQASFPSDVTTEVDVRFERVGEETRVTVEHLGWDAVPAANAARHGFPDGVFLTRHGEWWRVLLSAYKARLP